MPVAQRAAQHGASVCKQYGALPEEADAWSTGSLVPQEVP